LSADEDYQVPFHPASPAAQGRAFEGKKANLSISRLTVASRGASVSQ
jgi:hypothetical protein